MERESKNMKDETQWMDIVEYSIEKKISLSTIRRRIKTGKINVIKKDGKYFIMNKKSSKDYIQIQEEKMKIIEQENLELKMLLHLYEQKLKIIL